MLSCVCVVLACVSYVCCIYVCAFILVIHIVVAVVVAVVAVFKETNDGKSLVAECKEAWREACQSLLCACVSYVCVLHMYVLLFVYFKVSPQ